MTESIPTYNVNISVLNHGYMLNVGCQSFAIENADRLLVCLTAYFKNPSETIDNWLNKKILPE